MFKTIKARMRVSWFFGLLAIIGIVGINLALLAAANEKALELKTRWIPLSQTASAINTMTSDYRIIEARHILALDSSAVAEADKQLTAENAAIEKAFASLAQIEANDAIEAETRAFKSQWDSYVANGEAMLNLSRSNQKVEATDLFRGRAAAFAALSASLERLIDNASAEAAGANGQTERLFKFALMLSAAIGVVMVLGTIGGALFFEHLVIRSLDLLSGMMGRLAQGDHQVTIVGLDREDEVGAMARNVEVFKENAIERARLEAAAEETHKAVDRRLKETEAAFEAAGRAQKAVVDAMAQELSRLAQGDLTTRMTETVAPEYEVLKADFNRALETLEEAISSLARTSSAIDSGAQEMTQAADDLSHRTEQQAASLEETAAALDEITATVRRTAAGAKEAASVITNARTDAEASGEVVHRAVAAMSQIEHSSHQISQIIGVIDEIAFQTNLLALNAGVEAARAGEARRGFAVVASEVRALAQRSADAAKEIKTLISTSSGQVEEGVTLVGEAGEALRRIVGHVESIDGLVRDIAGSAQEQATGLQQVNTAVNQMDQMTQQNAAMVEETSAATHTLRNEADELTSLVGRFQVGGRAAARRPTTAVHAAQAKIAAFARGGAAPAAAPPAADWEEF